MSQQTSIKNLNKRTHGPNPPLSLLAVKLRVATNLRSSSFRAKKKPLIYPLTQILLIVSALLTTRLSSTLCEHLFSTWCHWFGLLLELQCDPVSHFKCTSLRE